MFRSSSLLVLIAGGVLLAACGQSSPTSAGAASADSQPAAAKAAPATEAAGAAKVQSVGDLFPPGPGRTQVLDTCGSCHPVACSARGQRTPQQWDKIGETHKDKLTGVSDADYKALFAYLKANFNETKPEPEIPAEFLEPSCTPY
jgi:hypothetical protein